LVDKLVEWIKVGRSCTIHIVPPVTDKVLLVENGTVGAQKCIVVAIGLAHVEDLQLLKNYLSV
jgi:hypothetical protein